MANAKLVPVPKNNNLAFLFEDCVNLLIWHR